MSTVTLIQSFGNTWVLNELHLDRCDFLLECEVYCFLNAATACCEIHAGTRVASPGKHLPGKISGGVVAGRGSI